MRKVTLVPTGTANTASVVAALSRLGASIEEAETADDVAGSSGVVVPGVGAYGTAMARVESLGLRQALRDRIDAQRPTLAVCVGMQLLSRASEESPAATGLQVLEERVTRFGDGVRVPQMGWNTVTPDPGARLVEPGWAYFANSYRFDRVPTGWVGSRSDHGGTFVSALENGDVLACQFHPELSGEWGAQLLERWLQAVEAA